VLLLDDERRLAVDLRGDPDRLVGVDGAQAQDRLDAQGVGLLALGWVQGGHLEELAEALVALSPITDPLDEILRPVTDLTDSLITGLTPVTDGLAPIVDDVVPVDDEVPVRPVWSALTSPALNRKVNAYAAAFASSTSATPLAPDQRVIDSYWPGPRLLIDGAHGADAPVDRARSAAPSREDPGSPPSWPSHRPAPDRVPSSPGSATKDRGGDSGAKIFEGFVGAAPTNPRTTATSVAGTHRSEATDGPGRQPGFAPD